MRNYLQKQKHWNNIDNFLIFFDDIFKNSIQNDKTVTTISNEFLITYGEILFSKNRLYLLDNICKIIAATEFNQYDKCRNNC